jgi:hypothetical protein
MQKMESGKDSDERKLEKAGQNADTSTEDALLNRKKAMAYAEIVICRKLEKAGQNADASTEDVLLNKNKVMASAEMVICRTKLEKGRAKGCLRFHRGRRAAE